MKTFIVVAALAAVILGACSSTVSSLEGKVTTFLQTSQPVASEVACAAQALANATGAAADLLVSADAIDGGAAQTAAAVSKDAATGSAIVGKYCPGLTQGALLPTPVTASGTATVNGVTVPVPVTTAAPVAGPN